MLVEGAHLERHDDTARPRQAAARLALGGVGPIGSQTSPSFRAARRLSSHLVGHRVQIIPLTHRQGCAQVLSRLGHVQVGREQEAQAADLVEARIAGVEELVLLSQTAKLASLSACVASSELTSKLW